MTVSSTCSFAARLTKQQQKILKAALAEGSLGARKALDLFEFERLASEFGSATAHLLATIVKGFLYHAMILPRFSQIREKLIALAALPGFGSTAHRDVLVL
jgi:hypothetical protein